MGPVPVPVVVTLLEALLWQLLACEHLCRHAGVGEDVQLRASARVALRLAGPCLCKDANVQGASGAALHTQCARRLSLRTALPSMAQGLRHRARRSCCLSARVRGARAARRSGRRAAGARVPRSARAARWSGRRAAGVRMPRSARRAPRSRCQAAGTRMLRSARAAQQSGRRAAGARMRRSARRARRSACQAWSGGAPCHGRPGWTSAEAHAAPPYWRQSAETGVGAVRGCAGGLCCAGACGGGHGLGEWTAATVSGGTCQAPAEAAGALTRRSAGSTV